MGNVVPITLLKLGGSLITNKDKALTINSSALRRIVSTIQRSALPSGRRRLIIVHGGGSFGHYYAKKFGISIEPKVIAPLDISRTTESMINLHSIVLRALVSAGVATETILAQDLMTPGSAISQGGLKRMQNALALNLVPVSFGNVGTSGSSAYIISGDTICEAIFHSMPVDRVIFAMDVDGIYPSTKLNGKILKTIRKEDEIETGNRLFDVTGGIKSKICLGFRIAHEGAEVFYVNGNKPQRLLNLLRSRDNSAVKATIIMPAKRREF